MKIHNFDALEANALAFRYTLLSLICAIITVLEIRLLDVGTFWQIVGVVGSLAFMLAAHRAISAPRREEARRLQRKYSNLYTADSFVDPL